ncbi:hypothetical protein [Secundilactobacillus silagei]|uniref:Lipoprotein n=1 Tax=Secundilactobacillus silagei JCM 19001 TaxID=1302250 RepID=A0A1Z5H3J2_9LACO|nr:hypothetical protein [Secundilactobacillus silagei]TDG70362.1 hypothetical protein C5L25_001552 [Secundilactobacillus silagei JCM 19001]GAT17866.1 hypothetical protein IWT126_00123 [Secundilactobacillus silagei JCM 19001]
MMKPVIKFVLPLAVLGLLGGCGSQTKSHSASSNKPKTSKVAKNKAVNSSNSAASQSSVTQSSSDSESSVASSQSSSSSEHQHSVKSPATSQQPTKASSAKTKMTQAHPAVTQQSVASKISQTLGGQYAPQDLAFQFSQSGAGTYTVQVQENHQSPNMKAKGADPSTSPTVAWFKTNTNGQLLKSVDGGATYTVVGNAY